eukprot:853411-Alexandrium_andersonii.AAC.1
MGGGFGKVSKPVRSLVSFFLPRGSEGGLEVLLGGVPFSLGEGCSPGAPLLHEALDLGKEVAVL